MTETAALPKKPGRKPSNKPRNVGVTISLPPEMHDALRQLGGSPWVQQKIREALAEQTETDKAEKGK